MNHKLLLIYIWFVRTILFFLPDLPPFMRFRGWLYGFGMKKCGRDFQVTHDAVIKGLQFISVGNHVFVGNHSMIIGGGTIEIEDEVQLAPHVILISGNHTSNNRSYRYGKGDMGHIHIGRGAWVAGNATVQKDTFLPANSVLSANSFLNKVFTEEDSIYGGVPAKFIKKIENA